MGTDDHAVDALDAGDELEVEVEMAGATSICVGCGLCCDGTVLSHLAVSDDSDLGVPLRTLGVQIIAEADPPVFALPCPAVDGGRCSIYHLHRPRACGQFECDVAAAVAAGTMARSTAEAVIADTIALRDRVRARTADETTLRLQVDTHFLASRSQESGGGGGG